MPAPCSGGSSAAAASLREQRDYLTQLDAAIGDADHGDEHGPRVRGVVERSSTSEDPRIRRASCSSTAGSTLVSTVGGASGPLWGTALRRAGRVARRRRGRSAAAELVAALEAALAGVVELGAAQRGREDDGRRARAGGADAARARRRRRRRSPRRSPPRARPARRGCGRPCRCRREGPRVVPRRAEHRPPGPGRDVDGAHPRARSSSRSRRRDERAACCSGLGASPAGSRSAAALVLRDLDARAATHADAGRCARRARPGGGRARALPRACLREAALADEAEILEANRLMAEDPSLSREVARARRPRRRRPRRSASRSGGMREPLWPRCRDPLLAARAADVRELGRRAVRALRPARREVAGSGPGLDPRRARARAGGDRRAPSSERASMLGVALAEGSATSHAAIIARSLGVPMVVALGDDR